MVQIYRSGLALMAPALYIVRVLSIRLVHRGEEARAVEHIGFRLAL